MSLELFAKAISRLFDFPIWATVLLVVALFNTGLSAGQIKILAPVLLVVDLISPIAIFVLLLRNGTVSDIDVTIRSQRYRIFGYASLASLLSTIVIYFLGNYYFFVLSAAGFLVTFTLFLITLKWKISGHMIINCTGIFIINHLLGWQYTWLFLIVPFVTFARLYLKKHTVSQVLAGGVLGLLEPYVVLKLFNVI